MAIVIGVVGSVNNWVIAPTSGLSYAAKSGYLPTCFARCNRRGAPYFLLLLQAVLVTVISLIFVFLPSVNESYWFLTAMATQQYALMYLLMFATGVKQRYQRDNDHGYRVPGGNGVMWCLCGMGFVTMLFVIGLGLMSPVVGRFSLSPHYSLMVLIGMVALVLPALALFQRDS